MRIRGQGGGSRLGASEATSWTGIDTGCHAVSKSAGSSVMSGSGPRLPGRMLVE